MERGDVRSRVVLQISVRLELHVVEVGSCSWENRERNSDVPCESPLAKNEMSQGTACDPITLEERLDHHDLLTFGRHDDHDDRAVLRE